MERRSNRSRAPELATRFYLLAVSQRHAFERLVLADERGHLLAGVETRPFMDSGRVATRVNERVGRELASVAPLVCGSDDPVVEKARPWTRLARLFSRVAHRVRLAVLRRKAPAPIVATPFEAGEHRFFLVGAGAAEGALQDAAEGLRRILIARHEEELAAAG
jgi:hypothetical protein